MNKFDIVLVDLNLVKWSEQSWIRPCIIIQNNYANKISRTYVVAILSSVIKDYPHTLIVDESKINWLSQKTRIDLLQIRTIDKSRIIKQFWELDLDFRDVLDEKIKIAFGL